MNNILEVIEALSKLNSSELRYAIETFVVESGKGPIVIEGASKGMQSLLKKQEAFANERLQTLFVLEDSTRKVAKFKRARLLKNLVEASVSNSEKYKEEYEKLLLDEDVRDYIEVIVR